MKTDYVTRATRFAESFIQLLDEHKRYKYPSDFVMVIKKYEETHKRHLKYDNGASRFVIIRSDYVIKINRDYNGWAGDNSTEVEKYNEAVKAGFDYLLAKPTPVKIGRFNIIIMPRIKYIGSNRRWYKYCTDEEQKWISRNIDDLHSYNYGFCNGKLCIIDYAMI